MQDPIIEYNADPPQDATRVARRTLVLMALVCRANIESASGQPDAVLLHNRVHAWMTRFDLWDEIEPNEDRILRTPLGQLTPQDVIRITWLVEGAVILAWSLYLFELPRHDQQVDSFDVAESVWFLSEDADELIRTAKLRSSIELEACRELMYAIAVRLSNFVRHHDKIDFSSWVEGTWIEALKIDVTHLVIDNDLAIDDHPINTVELSRIRECSVLTRERHKAIIWLTEGYSVYSQTPVDT